MLDIEGEAPALMERDADGWHRAFREDLGPGTRYRYVLEGGTKVVDPAARFQPDDVHGFSEVVDPGSYGWTCEGWNGRPWHEAVIYELHVGAFSEAGTFAGVREKLDHLVTLGATALELMPIADFSGRWNWGYDGVLPYAPDSSYGGPDDLKALIDAAHERGLMVILDVVYNHFGPDGAYIHTVAPEMFTDRHATPWGKAVNTDGPRSWALREFFIQNALYWLGEFRLDGLRLDAVHAIRDDSGYHFLSELAERVRAAFPDRHIHLILENEENESTRLAPVGPFTAQWNDDVHHVLHVALTGERSSYYADYVEDTHKLGRALAEGFAFQGEVMSFRGSPRGQRSSELPPTAFVAFLQNHDQVGNRPMGERLTVLADARALRAAAAAYLLLPQIPMLFMGEEWGTRRPFPFFCDFSGELAQAVREGRKKELEKCPDRLTGAPPDPLDEATFRAAKLDWAEREHGTHAETLAWYQRILHVRRTVIGPLLRDIRGAGAYEIIGEGAVVVRWRVAETAVLMLAANLSGHDVDGFPEDLSRLLWAEGAANDGGYTPWTVRWSITPL
jgi:malto-oligosyltrehalose trehalohydrolase